MTFVLRPYQQRVIDKTYEWWMSHPEFDQIPIMVLPTGAGKSVVLAELVRLLFEYFPEDHPRTVVLVPSKELAEQNAEKLSQLLPKSLRVGYYSASLGRKDKGADVIVATIGSIYKKAAEIGNIKIVLIDECHLVSTSGEDAGRYRQFLKELSGLCSFRVAGCTATPFRGNGVWLTDGEAPLFNGISATVTINELIDGGFLSHMVRPIDAIKTRIDVSDVGISNGDYKIGELGDRVGEYISAAVDEAIELAANRKKWIAFTPTVMNANQFVGRMLERGQSAAVVCGETPKADREDLIAAYRRGEIRCLVTVLALATGFDVPDVDCVIWMRPTKSPVLYVQGAGRGLRIAPGKEDCLWVDFSDTTERMGPIDSIKGRKKREAVDQEAPFAICPNCGEVVRPASLMFCPSCGAKMREEEVKKVEVSTAPVLTRQIEKKIRVHPVKSVSYSVHRKDGKPDSMKVTYSGGLVPLASEWVCFEHGGFARTKAEDWWQKRTDAPLPRLTRDAVAMSHVLRKPAFIKLDESNKYPEIIGMYSKDPREEREVA